MNLLKEVKITRVMNAQAAGTTDVNSNAVDMQGFESVLFVVAFGTIDAGAVTSIKVQESDDASFSTAYDIEGSRVSIADDEDNKLLIIEVHKPLRRYVRVVVDRGTANAVIDGAIALQFGVGYLPVTQDSTVAASELHVCPDEGTA